MTPDKLTISFSRQELLNWASGSVAFYRLDLSRISTVFLAQTYTSEKNRIFDTFDLTNPIKILEGIPTVNDTPPEEQFKHHLLAGLYKKHFSSPRFLVKNLQNFQRSKEGAKHFEKVWKKACKITDSGIIDETFIGYLCHHMTVPPFEIKRRSNSMTGEWIVFHKHEGHNYYLTIAFHGESNDQIYEKVMLACSFDRLPFRL